MARDATSAASLLARAEAAWAGGDGPTAIALFERAASAAEGEDDVATRTAAVLGLARGQRYNLTPGRLPVRLHAAYDATDDPRSRARLAAALARCWSYADEPRRAGPFAVEALRLAEGYDDPVLLADALDAALVSHWGPDDLAQRRDWAVRLADSAAHLADPEARLQAQLWSLTVAWEVLDLPRMHRSMRALELLAEESPRAEFFAASRRLPIELLRGNHAVTPVLLERAAAAARSAVVPDAQEVLHSMRGYAAFFAGDARGCAREAPAFEEYAVEFGVATVRAEAAVIWLGAGRADKAAEMIGVFTPEVLDDLPRNVDWLLVLQCVLEAAIALGDKETTASVVELLASYAGRSVLNSGAVMWHGTTDDTLARGHLLLGDRESAARHRLAALATYERIGAVWWRERLRDWPSAETPRAAGPVTVHFHRQRTGLWVLGREDATFELPPMRGLTYLHALLDRPDTDRSAISLAAAAPDLVVEQSGLEDIDEDSRRILTARLRELDTELEYADRADLREERRLVADYLARGTGLGRRSRASGSNAERARVAVRKAVVAAMARIAEADPWLGRHLHDRVRTGFQCRYRSDPERPVRWLLEPTER